jgi:iron complex transport system ATP-binding protein
MSAAIRADGVGVTLGGRDVLAGVTLDVEYGEVLALVGPNGAGKSTLLGVLSGERAPSTGRVTIDDRELGSYSALELARRRAVLTQDNQLSFPFRVSQIVEMGRSPWLRTPQFDDDERVLGLAMERTDVAELAARRFTELSGGERARVSLARVRAQDTGIVRRGEPIAARDLRHQEGVLRLARELAREGRAIVIVLHDLSLAGAYADRVGLVSDGALVAIGTPHEVLTAPAISRVYGLAVEVIERDGRPVVIPLR